MGNKKVSCLIVDDEPLSREILEEYVELCPELNLSGICSNALDAGKIIREKEIDLLLLDINMPKLSGISFIKGLSNPPLFIFITAYPEYAIEGFEIDATDYLVKPVSFERFRKAVNRSIERINLQRSNFDEKKHIMVKADNKKYLIKFEDLFFIEAMGDYVRLNTKDKKLTVHTTLKEIFSRLPEQFVQIHKSFVINASKVSYLEGNQVVLESIRLPVSIVYKENLLKKL